VKRVFVASLLVWATLLIPRVSAGDRHWEHEHREHERWEHERWHPRVYPVVPFGVVVPAPAPVCPVQCWSENVCNAYGWCHWERHCEPRCY
jgi:hypothetical protein